MLMKPYNKFSILDEIITTLIPITFSSQLSYYNFRSFNLIYNFFFFLIFQNVSDLIDMFSLNVYACFLPTLRNKREAKCVGIT